MKLLIVQPTIPHYRKSLFNALSNYCDLTVAASHVAGQVYSFDKVKYKTILLGQISEFTSLIWQRDVNKLKLSEYDTIILWGNLRCLSIIYLMLKAKFLSIDVILWTQLPKITPIKRLIAVRWFSLAKAVLLYTDTEIVTFNRELSTSIRVGAVNNGLDKNLIRQFRIDNIFSHNEFVFIGRDTKKAKLGFLLQSCQILFDKGVDFKLHIVGMSNNDFQDYPYIQSHGVLTDEGEISRIMNRSAFFVYAGDVGLSLIHAMSYGLPILIHDNMSAHMPEVAALEDYEEKYFFDRDNNLSLANKISTLLACKTLDRNKGFISTQKYSTDDSAQNIIRLLS